MTDNTATVDTAVQMETQGFDWKGTLGDAHDAFSALIEAKGWKGPADALQSYAHLEKTMGGEKLVIPGADASAQDWTDVWSRLGRPDTSEGYELKAPDGQGPYDTEIAGWFAKAAHSAGLTKDQAVALHGSYLGLAKDATQSVEGAIVRSELECERALRSEWGSAYAANLASAKRAINTFAGEDAGSLIDGLEDVVGAPKVLKLFAKIGEAIAEDRLVAGETEGLAASPSAARAEIAKIRREATGQPNHPYLNQHHPDYRATQDKMRQLYDIAYSTAV